MRMALDHQSAYARDLVTRLTDVIGNDLAARLLDTDQSTDEGINKEREVGQRSKSKTALECDNVEARDL